jgi:hypothetical protein
MKLSLRVITVLAADPPRMNWPGGTAHPWRAVIARRDSAVATPDAFPETQGIAASLRFSQ